jgi:hypothetical protein
MTPADHFERLWRISSQIVEILDREFGNGENPIGNMGAVSQIVLGRLHARTVKFTDDAERAWASFILQEFAQRLYGLGFEEEKRRMAPSKDLTGGSHRAARKDR